MKKTLLLSALLCASQFASAQSFVQAFTGVFTDGDLNGYTIEGLFEIDTMGLSSGDADLSGTGPEILEFTFEIFDPGSFLFTDFIESDDPDALATFDTIAPATDPQVTTFDFIGLNFNSETLDFFYDAFAATPATAFAVEFDDGFGSLSNATLSLQTAVPEPSAFALLFGSTALSIVILRRRR